MNGGQSIQAAWASITVSNLLKQVLVWAPEPMARSYSKGGDPAAPSGVLEKRSLLLGVAMWGCSSAGRAPALQAGGHRFDPGQLHQI